MTLVFMKQWDIEVALTAVPRFGYPSYRRTSTHPTFRYSVTILTLIPSVVHQLVHHPKFTKTDWSKIASMGSGAAYLPPKLSAQLLKAMPKEVDFGEGALFLTLSCSPVQLTITPVPGQRIQAMECPREYAVL